MTARTSVQPGAFATGFFVVQCSGVPCRLAFTMKKAIFQAAILGGTPDDIEQSFYEALRNGDLEQLMACWAEEEDIVCVHPGGPRWIGAAAIRHTFEGIFANGPVQARPERVHKILSLACAVHHLIERIDVQTPHGQQQAFVIATNVYQKTPQGWRMVAHHTSPGTKHDAVDAETPVLH